MPTPQKQHVVVGVDHILELLPFTNFIHTYIKVVRPNVEATQLNPAAVLSGLNNWVLMIV